VAQLERAQPVGLYRVPELSRHRSREQTAAHSNLSVDAPSLDLHPLLHERLLPSEDVSVDGVHQRAIQIENQGLHRIAPCPEVVGSGKRVKAASDLT
jgi:hypothetical protein